MKVCTRCAVSQPLSNFFARKASKDGLQPACKGCDQAARRARKDANADREKAYHAAYRAKHATAKRYYFSVYYRANKAAVSLKNAARYQREKVRYSAKRKEWAEKNADLVSSAKKSLRLRNGALIRSRRRQHYRDNKARYIANARAREAQKMRAMPAWADADRIAAIYEESERLTAETGIVHHVDHVIPLRGKWVCGLHVHTNLQVIPWMDNLAKSNRFEQKG